MATFFRKKVFDKVGLLDESYHYTMDHELWIRISRDFNFVTIDKDLAKFRKYKASKTGSMEIKFASELLKVKRKYGAKWFSYDNFRLLFMFVKEPFKRIPGLRTLVRKLKGKNKKYWYYR